MDSHRPRLVSEACARQGASSNSGALFFTFPTAFDTGQLVNASSFAGFICAAASSG